MAKQGKRPISADAMRKARCVMFDRQEDLADHLDCSRDTISRWELNGGSLTQAWALVGVLVCSGKLEEAGKLVKMIPESGVHIRGMARPRSGFHTW